MDDERDPWAADGAAVARVRELAAVDRVDMAVRQGEAASRDPLSPRRGQDYPSFPPDLRQSDAQLGRICSAVARYGAAPARVARWASAILPDHQSFSAICRCSRTCARRGAWVTRVVDFWSRADRLWTSGRRAPLGLLPDNGARRQGGDAGRPSLPRREAAPGAGDRAVVRSGPALARRADGGDEPRGDGRDDRPHPRAGRRAHDRAGRAQDEARDGHLRPDHRADTRAIAPDGTPDEIRSNELVQRTYLGVAR